MQTYVCTKCKYRTCVCAVLDGLPKPTRCPSNELNPNWHIAGGNEK